MDTNRLNQVVDHNKKYKSKIKELYHVNPDNDKRSYKYVRNEDTHLYEYFGGRASRRDNKKKIN